MAIWLGGCMLALFLAGCDNQFSQPRDNAWHAATEHPATGVWPPRPPEHMVGRDAVDTSAPPLSLVLLQRGRERFGIYCAPCHGPTGDGHGMIVQRGFPAPPPYTSDRLLTMPTSHFVDVITNGYGVMFSYADRVAPEDRWAIAAYIRALQQSQHAEVASLPPELRAKLR
jgi:mono/diheme cytochrome c family protein